MKTSVLSPIIAAIRSLLSNTLLPCVVTPSVKGYLLPLQLGLPSLSLENDYLLQYDGVKFTV